MKKNLYIILMLLLSSTFSYSAEPLVRFYLQDGRSKSFNMDDIETFTFQSLKNVESIIIFLNDSIHSSISFANVDKISFFINKDQHRELWVYQRDRIKSFDPGQIDSLIFLNIKTNETVSIGTQIWMSKNLDLAFYRNGDTIPQITDSLEWANLTTGAWCYYNNDSELGKIYGKLYNWYAINDSRCLAPKGWHIPSDFEWETLSNFLGGINNAGNKLKESGISHWADQYYGTTNETGFTALPGGYRSSIGSLLFYGIGSNCYFWSSSEKDQKESWYWKLQSKNASFNNDIVNKVNGMSIRCIRD